MTTPDPLPWDAPDSTAPTGSGPELDAIPSVPPPAPTGDLIPPPPPPNAEQTATQGDLAATAQAALATAAAKAQDIAKAEIEAHLKGQSVVLSTTSASGQQIRFADAKSRALRTLAQNMAVDILVALGTVLPMLLTMNFTDTAAWTVFGTSVAKTVVAVFVSYVSRLSTEPVIPTPVETPSGAVVQPPPGSHAAG